MVKIKWIYIVLPLVIMSKISFSQIINFDNPETIVRYLDGKTFVVPEYGTISFTFNKKKFKLLNDKKNFGGNENENDQYPFDIDVKRLHDKAKSVRRDKNDYETTFEQRIDKMSVQDPNNHKIEFDILRSIIYPIKSFPSHYVLFSDGTLYYRVTIMDKVPFKEYKAELLKHGKYETPTKNIFTECPLKK